MERVEAGASHLSYGGVDNRKDERVKSNQKKLLLCCCLCCCLCCLAGGDGFVEIKRIGEASCG